MFYHLLLFNKIRLCFELSSAELSFADYENRDKDLDRVTHLVNIDIQDNHEEATIGAFMICEMVTMVSVKK